MGDEGVVAEGVSSNHHDFIAWAVIRSVSTRSVKDYQMKFIELISPLDGVTDEVALGKFISGPYM